MNFCSDGPSECTAWRNLKSVAFPVPETIGGTRKIWAVPGYATHPILQFFSWAFIRMDPVIVLAKFEVPGIIAIGVLGGMRTPNLGKGRP